MKRRTRRPALPKGNPVARALALQTMDEHLRSVGVHVYMQQEGEESADLLADLAWVIGVGAETAHRTAPGQADSRRLHGALRSVVQMAATGCRWQRLHAQPLYAAAQDAKALLVRHRAIAEQMTEGADYLAAQVRAGRATLDMVAGAEIYPTTPATTTGAAA